MHRASWSLLGAALVVCAATPVAAQHDALSIRASRRDTIVAAAAVTAVFAVTNRAADSIHVTPRVQVPSGWTLLLGGKPLDVAPEFTEMLVVSASVPARAAAGVYTIRVEAGDSGTALDSVLVMVPERRALDVALLDRPGFVVSGRAYDATFSVRNRGNADATILIHARGTQGVVALNDTTIPLRADQARVVRARVVTHAGLQAAGDDVLEIAARVAGDSTESHASARVTVVPEPSRRIEEYLRVPAQMNLRGASSDGVSPMEVFGRGPIRDGGSTDIDFLFRAPTGRFAVLGEREEYRVELRAPSWRARAGDHVFLLSSLSGSAQPGFGLGAEGTRGMFTAGGFGQSFRRLPEGGREVGAFVSAEPVTDGRIGVYYSQRTGGSPALAGRIASTSAALHRESFNAALEIARSQSDAGVGLARLARLSGQRSSISYDLGHQFADTLFSGTQRGGEHDYATLHADRWESVSLVANASSHRADLSRSAGVPYIERLRLGSVAATAFDRFTLDVGSVVRSTTVQSVRQQSRQHSVRGRVDQSLSFGYLAFDAEIGRANDAAGTMRMYNDLSLSGRRQFAGGSASVYVERYSGGSVIKGEAGVLTVGGDVSTQIHDATSLMVMAYATRQTIAGAQWHSQLDARLSHALSDGRSITLRTRLLGGGSLTSSEQNVFFLEYGMPLRIPVSRLRTTGRVMGRVVDAVTGKGVSNALVRLGPQVAITDRQGQVAFGGVPGGEHRLSMSQETSFANAVFVGDPTLLVDSTRTQPTTFELAIARSARIDVDIRRFVVARTAMAGAPDSVADAGALANATLMLAGERDTLYRTTGENGKTSFADVPPGRWTITIRGDAPAYHRFDPDRMEVTLAPGEIRTLGFRLVPRRREVQVIGDGQELQATPADPKQVPASSGLTRTRKPLEREERRDRQER